MAVSVCRRVSGRRRRAVWSAARSDTGVRRGRDRPQSVTTARSYRGGGDDVAVVRPEDSGRGHREEPVVPGI